MANADKEWFIVNRIRNNNGARDSRMKAIHLVRSNRANQVFQGLFPSDWPQPIIANFIDVVAKDTAEMVGVLPTLTSAGDSILDESKRSRQDKKTRIINYLAYASRLGIRLVTAADRLSSYGFVPFRVEPNYTDNRPHVHVDDSLGAYYEKDRFGELAVYARYGLKRASELAYLYPEHRSKIIKDDAWATGSEEWLEVITYYDKNRTILFLPKRNNLILDEYANPISRIPVRIAELPSVDDMARGQFDDVLWVYAAKARLALFSIEATQKAVEAPIALPNDVQEFAFGPDAILRSQNPQQIRRVPLELPQSAMIENKVLDEELRFGARFPDGRAGQTDASVVTGRGMQALMGGFDARIKTAQAMLGEALGEALSLALEMDEVIWGGETKEAFASVNGVTFDLKYDPAKDLKGDWSVTHEYGAIAGLDPNRALVWGLQALGAGLVSKSFIQRSLPVNINVTEEQKVIDIEKLRESALMSIQSYAQALPQMATQGQDPSQVVKVIGDLIAARKKGTPIEKAIEDAFAPTPALQATRSQSSPGTMQEDPAASMADQMGVGTQGGGGVNVPQQQPQGLQQLLAGLTASGQPSMTARTMRQNQVA